MTCTKTVPMDTQTATTPGGRSIVPRDATFAKVSRQDVWLITSSTFFPLTNQRFTFTHSLTFC